MFVGKTKIRVIFADTDGMGIVYHSNYIKWFEAGRNEYLRDIGYEYTKMEREGIWTPVIEVHCKYKNPAKFDDVLRVETRIKELGAVKFTMSYEIFNDETNQLIMEGSTVHVITSPELKPIRLDKENPKLYELFKKCWKGN